MTTRRQFLQTSLAAGGIVGTGLGVPSALANPGGDYKALVCITMEGGMDGHDCLVPTGASEYGRWAELRASVLAQHGHLRERSGLLPLSGSGSPGFGFVPDLSPFSKLYDEGSLAVVANVGPLREPTDRAAIKDGRSAPPARLGSHNDQRSVWHTGGFDGTPVGWGGKLVDETGETETAARINIGSPSPMGASDVSVGFNLTGRGLNLPFGVGRDALFDSVTLPGLIEKHYRMDGRQMGNMFMREVAAAKRSALETVELVKDVAASDQVGRMVQLDGNGLSADLGLAADIINGASSLGVRRQLFVLQLNGWDSHADHFASVPDLQTKLAEAVFAFHRAMESIGMAQNVTTFTLSEFGRTLQGNSTGTDHGWGNHHFVVGGAVRGGRVVGEMPPYDLGHDHDWRRGATIPTLSIEQYGAGLGRWFGNDEAALSRVFPNLSRFDPYAADLF